MLSVLLDGGVPEAGAVSLAGACPLAPSFDTCGWFARSASMLSEVGEVLLAAPRREAGGPLLRPRRCG
jgi:amidase